MENESNISLGGTIILLALFSYNKNWVYIWSCLTTQLLINLLVITLYSRFFTFLYHTILLLGETIIYVRSFPLIVFMLLSQS